MSHDDQDRLQQLWEEYRRPVASYDDPALARWIAQTLGQLKGQIWRLSHPLVGLHRLLATTAHKRGLRVARLAQVPDDFPRCTHCDGPLLPLVTRDLVDDGLVCETCGGSAVAFADLPEDLTPKLRQWAESYASVHAVAHWADDEKNAHGDYEKAYQQAAEQAETLLLELAQEHLPALLDHYPALVWEDHDECLDVRPDDVVP
ncbi:MAG: hypothetical protein SFU85_07355 [Candidatus Methylacidiphilales bacterium]|nr:hypothetical protein [Candidatus Methylacidiphilales bacterium]